MSIKTPLRRAQSAGGRIGKLLYRALSAVLVPQADPRLPPELRFPPF